ncbi:MAG TPA: hypothetical protein VGF76_05255 [Polyangiaceae bacterium]
MKLWGTSGTGVGGAATGAGVGAGRSCGSVTAESGIESKASRMTTAGSAVLITGGGGGAIDTESRARGRRATSIGQLAASVERSSGALVVWRRAATRGLRGLDVGDEGDALG